MEVAASNWKGEEQGSGEVGVVQVQWQGQGHQIGFASAPTPCWLPISCNPIPSQLLAVMSALGSNLAPPHSVLPTITAGGCIPSVETWFCKYCRWPVAGLGPANPIPKWRRNKTSQMDVLDQLTFLKFQMSKLLTEGRNLFGSRLKIRFSERAAEC